VLDGKLNTIIIRRKHTKKDKINALLKNRPDAHSRDNFLNFRTIDCFSVSV
jgi:hypothetical protein